MEQEDLLFIPPMLLQPIIENCIVHGFSTIDYKGEITIHLTKVNKFVLCEIEDNGVGLIQDQKRRNQKRKSSTQLISEFLEKVTKTKLEFINKTDGLSGTIVRFKLPYKYSQFD